MIIKRSEVFAVIDTHLPFRQALSGIESKFFKCLCIQEAEKVPNHPDEFDLSVAALEEGFYRGYVKKEDWSTVVEVMLSASFGATQIMGLELQSMGYFQDHYNLMSLEQRAQYPGGPLESGHIARCLDAFCVSVDAQIRYTFILMEKKLKTAVFEDFLVKHPDWRTKPVWWRLARLWNGDIDGRRGYAEAIEKKMNEFET